MKKKTILSALLLAGGIFAFAAGPLSFLSLPIPEYGVQ